MAGVNKCIIIGNLGRDPEIKYTQSNVPVANLSVATTESWKDKNSGEWQEKTEWHRIVAWRHLAERAERFLRKGKQVYIEGRIETRNWEDQSGQKHWMTEIIAQQMQLLGRRDENEQQAASGGSDKTPAASGGNFDPAPLEGGAASRDEDDDLPF
jgi:single-strand DNA-binding protein